MGTLFVLIGVGICNLFIADRNFVSKVAMRVEAAERAAEIGVGDVARDCGRLIAFAGVTR